MKHAWSIVVLLLLVSVGGCGPASKLRRAEKLIQKAESQGAVWNSDTVWVERVVVRPETRVDSVTILKPGDSVLIFKERLEVRIKRLRGDTIFVEGKCKTDTVIIRTPVNVYKTITTKGWLRWWMLLIAFLAGIIFWIGYLQVKKPERT